MSQRSTETKESADESTRILLDLAVALGSIANRREALETILDAAMKIEGVDCGGLYLLEGESASLRLARHAGLTPEFVQREARFAADTPENQLVRKGEPVYGTFDEMHIPLSATRRREGLRAIAVLPFHDAGCVIGCLNLASRTADVFPVSSRDLMQSIAARIGTPLHRIQAHENLENLYERYRRIVEKSGQLVVVAQDAQVRFATEAASSVLGYSHEELLTLPTPALIHPDDRERVVRNQLVRQAGRPVPDRDAFRVLAKDGSIHYAEMRATDMEWEGRPATLVFLNDITERRRWEKAQREGEERFRAVFHSAAQGIAVGNVRGRILQANEKLCEMLGYSLEELRGVRYSDITVPEDWERQQDSANLAKEGKIHSYRLEKRYIRKDGGILWADTTVSGLRDSRGELRAWVSMIIDIGDRKRAEENVRNLTQEIMRIQEEERRSIARDLHDHVAQDISSLEIACATLFDGQRRVPAAVRQRLAAMKGVLQSCVRSVRSLAYGLRPPELDQLGLAKTLGKYCEEFAEKSGLAVDFSSAGFENLNLASDARINLFRMVQEALSNARKHAAARAVKVRLVASSPSIIVRIEDDGHGFDVEQVLAGNLPGTHMGLQSMSERAGLLGGSMKIKCLPGQGAQVRIEIPIKENQE